MHTSVWKALFGKQADVLEKDDEHENTYMYGRDGVVVVVLGVGVNLYIFSLWFDMWCWHVCTCCLLRITFESSG